MCISFQEVLPIKPTTMKLHLMCMSMFIVMLLGCKEPETLPLPIDDLIGDFSAEYTVIVTLPVLTGDGQRITYQTPRRRRSLF